MANSAHQNGGRSTPTPPETPFYEPRELTFVEPLDSRSVTWKVREGGVRELAGVRTPGYLVFTSPMAMRRVYDFPADWFELSAAELLALSWRR